MSKFIAGSFLILGWSFYELSDGADFEPQTREPAQIATVAEVPTVIPFDEPVVTRASAIELPALTSAAADGVVVQASMTVAEVAVAEVAQDPEQLIDVRAVAGKRVNMRSGPGTNYSVLDTLDRGTQAEILTVDANGWAEIKILRTGQIGWMAERLLTNG